MATRQSDGFFFVVVQSRHEDKKNPTGHNKVNVTHCVFVCASQRERERGEKKEKVFSFVYRENYGYVASISLA